MKQHLWPDEARQPFEFPLNAQWADTVCSLSLIVAEDMNEGRLGEDYRRAADILAAQPWDVETGARVPERRLFPVLFLYRHAVELYLKRIVYLGLDCKLIADSKEIRSQLKREHELVWLWQLTRPVLEKRWPKGEPLILDNVAAFITALDRSDHKSFAFRYPTDKKGDLHAKLLPPKLDLTKISESFSAVLNLLDSCSWELYDTYQYMCEANRDR